MVEMGPCMDWRPSGSILNLWIEVAVEERDGAVPGFAVTVSGKGMSGVGITNVFVGEGMAVRGETVHDHARHDRRWPFLILFPGKEENRSIDPFYRYGCVLKGRSVLKK